MERGDTRHRATRLMVSRIALVSFLVVWIVGASLQTHQAQAQTAPPSAASASPAATSAKKKKKKPTARKKKRSGKINPCMTPDPGWGNYGRWSHAPSIGQMLVPKRGGITSRGGFDLIVHFHGRYPIRKEFVRVSRGMVLVAVDLGVSSGPYGRAFASPSTFTKLLRSIEKEMALRTGRRRAHVRKLGLSSWSAGYGAIAQILRQPAGRKVDALVLLDSVYGGYAGSSKNLKTATLTPFLKFARQAARGRKFMFQSFSSIQPPGYASTGEVAHYLVKQLGGRLRRTQRSDRYGLRMFERFDKRNYHVRGYRGEGKPDHCAHLGLMRDVIRVHLNRRWRSPRARPGRRKKVSKAKQRAIKRGNLHTVKKGEHLTGIARHHKTSITAIRRLNDLRKGQPLRIGQELLIPEAMKGKKASGKTTRAQGKTSSKKRLRPGHRIHVVASEQTLGSIARRYHVTVKTLQTANDLGPRQPIRPGQELIVPPPPPKRKRRR